MSSNCPIILDSSDTGSDSDLEGLVDLAFSEARKTLSRNNPKPPTTNNAATTTTTRRTRSSVKTKTKNKFPEKTDAYEKGSGDDVNVPFFIDTKPSNNRLTADLVQSTSHFGLGESDENSTSSSDSASKNEHKDEEFHKASQKNNKDQTNRLKSTIELSSSLQTGLDLSDIYMNVRSFQNPQASQHTDLPGILLSRKHDEIMKKSVITPDFEKQDKILPYSESMRKMKMKRRKERATTKGSNWFNMPATELTDERKNDLKVLQMRHALDPKRFYRANDTMAAPKYFQFGTVVESKADFYSSRVPKKQRKPTLVDELLADADFRKYNKRKYTEIQEAKRMGTGPYQKIRFHKKKKKTKK